MIPCPACKGYLRQRKTKGGHRIRCCLRCHKRYRTEEVILHEIGTMTEERLIKFMTERKGWQSYETIARHFCVTPKAAQIAIKKLEGEGRVHYKFGERGRKLWHLTDKPVAPTRPAPPPPTIIHRISDGDERTTPKPQNKRPVSPQTWFSVLGIKDRAP